MARIAVEIEYLGKAFCGSQMQVGVRTVQAELERALSLFFRTGGARICAILAGRTDAGVHARGQVAHFDVDERFILAAGLGKELESGDVKRMTRALNGILPRDLSISAAHVVDRRFHARYSATGRTYVYQILNREQRSALSKDVSFFIPSPLDLAAMKAACADLAGTHDFAAFKSSNADNAGSVCCVQRSELLSLGEGKLEFWISADHFVYNMVRIIVGTLIEIGLGKRPQTALSQALLSRDRRQAGPTAPAWGLCLNQVDYPAEFNYFALRRQARPEARSQSKSGDLES